MDSANDNLITRLSKLAEKVGGRVVHMENPRKFYVVQGYDKKEERTRFVVGPHCKTSDALGIACGDLRHAYLFSEKETAIEYVMNITELVCTLSDRQEAKDVVKSMVVVPVMCSGNDQLFLIRVVEE